MNPLQPVGAERNKFRSTVPKLLLAVALLLVAAAPHHHRTRPRTLCWFPDFGYQTGAYSRTLRSVSGSPILLRDPLPVGEMIRVDDNAVFPQYRPRPPRAIKAFQFVETPRLVIDHCSISEISLQIHESGDWILNLRADQNPRPDPLDAERKVTTMEPPRKFTEHLMRNQFFVRAYCYARYGPTGGPGLIGKPVVVPLEIKPFWVQKGLPRFYFVRSHDRAVAEFFDLIDRVEIEFSYREE